MSWGMSPASGDDVTLTPHTSPLPSNGRPTVVREIRQSQLLQCVTCYSTRPLLCLVLARFHPKEAGLTELVSPSAIGVLPTI